MYINIGLQLQIVYTVPLTKISTYLSNRCPKRSYFGEMVSSNTVMPMSEIFLYDSWGSVSLSSISSLLEVKGANHIVQEGPQIVMKNLGVAVPHIRSAQVAAFMKLGSPMWEIWVEGCVKRRKDLFSWESHRLARGKVTLNQSARKFQMFLKKLFFSYILHKIKKVTVKSVKLSH